MRFSLRLSLCYTTPPVCVPSLFPGVTRLKIIRGMASATLVLGFSFSALAQESASKPAPATPRNITIDDFFQIRDVAQPELSPDGQWVAYSIRTRILKDDKNEQRLWMISTHGGDAIPLTAE